MQDVTPVGPFDRWPTGLGFEYFYGTVFGNTSQWEPHLWRNTVRVPPRATPEQGYHYTTDITDEAIRWVRTHESLAPQKSYFLYFSTSGAHSPHHVPREWIEKYRGHFDQGWDRLREETFARQKKLGAIPANAKLTPRSPGLSSWNSLSADKKRLLARQMEVYAGFVAHTDHEIGRLVQAVRAGPRGDNTLILYIVGDNGAAPEGGALGVDNFLASFLGKVRSAEEQLQAVEELGSVQRDSTYASGWAWAGNTPFQWTKHVASHLGGMRNPLVVSWPARIKDRGGLRSQFTHANDVAATLYELAGVEFPEVVDGVKQLPLDGVSFAATFDRADAPSLHRVQYFEASGNRAIYQDGWMASARRTEPWHAVSLMPKQSGSFENDRWELYHLTEDFSQAHDLAQRYPDRLAALRRLFDEEARRNDVYPLGAGSKLRFPAGSENRRDFVYSAGFPGLAIGGPDFDRPHRITAHVVIPKQGAQGVIVASGSRAGGFTLYIQDQRLIYERNVMGMNREIITSSERVPEGRVELMYELLRNQADAKDGDRGRLYIDGRLVGEARLSSGRAITFGGIDVGQNFPSPVSSAYQPPFKFTGTLEKVHVQLTADST